MCSVHGEGVGVVAAMPICPVMSLHAQGGTYSLGLWVIGAFTELGCGDFRGLEEHVSRCFESFELCFPFCLCCPYLFSKVCLTFEAQVIF